MSQTLSVCRIALVLCFVVALSGIAAAQTKVDLSELSLEQLLNTQITSVSRKTQSLAGAPAAVFVISQEDIRRSGLSTVPELLRLVPGLQVARIDGSKWAISARGFNHRYSNKLLVLVDGRTFYRPTFSGVYWDTLDLMVEDIERIEVVRGPGGTMWGANAVNGVISIITRAASKTNGVLVTAGSGSEDRGLLSVRYGAAMSDRSALRVYGKFSDRAALRTGAGDSAGDDWRSRRAGFRFDHTLGPRDELMVQGDAYASTVHQRTHVAVLTPPFEEIGPDTQDPSGASALARWTRSSAPGRNFSVQAYYDVSRREDRAVHGAQRTLDLEVQHRFAAGRHDIVSSGQVRSTRLDMRTTELMTASPTLNHLTLVSGFVQDEIAFGPTFALTLGARLERHNTVGWEMQPNVRARWTPAPRHVLWTGTARAVRTPAWSERAMTLRFAVLPPEPARPLPVEILAGGYDTDRVEDVRAFEAGYRLLAHQRLSLDVAAFRNLHRAATSYHLDTPHLHTTPGPMRLIQPLLFGTDVNGESHGVETLGLWTMTEWLSLSASHTWLKLTTKSTDPAVVREFGPDLHLHNPEHQFTVRAQTDVGRVLVDAALYRVGRLRVDAIDGYTRLDAGASWRANSTLSLSAGGQNLLDARHQEFPRFVMDHPSHITRAFFVRSMWSF